jgi:hypothetical protein
MSRLQRQVLAPRGLSSQRLHGPRGRRPPPARRGVGHRRDRRQAGLLGADRQERDPRHHRPPRVAQPVARGGVRGAPGPDLTADAPVRPSGPRPLPFRATGPARRSVLVSRGGEGREAAIMGLPTSPHRRTTWATREGAGDDQRSRRSPSQPGERPRWSTGLTSRSSSTRPTREWASRRNTPTVDLYLYDIREDLRRRQTGMVERRDEQGHRGGAPARAAVLQAGLPHHRVDPASLRTSTAC